jgi:putative hemin transport protein
MTLEITMSQAATVATSPVPEASTLRLAWEGLLREAPTLRIRDAARQLGVSEAELVALDCGGSVMRLRPEWGEILRSMPDIGRVMVLTRNESAVHERHGCFEQVEVNGRMGLVLGPDIDLRLFLGQWRHGFAATQSLHSGTRSSLQFFDGQGNAVHKIYLTEDSNHAAYAELVERLRADDQTSVVPLEAAPLASATVDDSQVDREGLRQAWQALRDTHAFIGLLKKFQLTRTQALRLVGDDYAKPVGLRALRWILENAAARGVPIMVFVGNEGCIQIHTGNVQNIKAMGPWINVLDADFNLHLREDHIHSAWLVRKPTDDGTVTSLELFDTQGETIALLFGKRKPGIPESAEWQALTAGLAALGTGT